MVKNAVLNKYVKDIDGLYDELGSIEELFESEDMVIFRFGQIYRFLGLHGFLFKDEGKGELDAVAYLDSEAKEEVRIEFELNSSNFIRPGHDADKCDLLVCYEHDWREAPGNIDIFDFKSLFDTFR